MSWWSCFGKSVNKSEEATCNLHLDIVGRVRCDYSRVEKRMRKVFDFCPHGQFENDLR